MSTPPSDAQVRKLDPFRETPLEAVRELLQRAPMIPLAPEQILYRQGEPIRRDALLLVTGRLTVFVEGGGARKALADVWPGEFVGEAALFTRAAERTATVVSAANGWGIVITRELLTENPDQPAIVALEQHLIGTLARRIAAANVTLNRTLQSAAGAPAPAPSPAPNLAKASPKAPPSPAPRAADATPKSARPEAPSPADAPRRPRPPRPAPEAAPLTLSQRLSRWWSGTE